MFLELWFQMKKHKTGVIAAGFALFSMFFGAGNLIWPLILGGQAGDQFVYSTLGLLITGVSLPLLGLLGIMLFEGDYRAFFGQIGRAPAFVLILIIQAILGPVGSLPRLITLAHATLTPYMPSFINLPVFSILAGIFIFFLTIRRQRVVDLIGLFLAPCLILTLLTIVGVGFINPPPVEMHDMSHKESFFLGLGVGYNTLDLIASFIFGTLLLSYFMADEKGVETKLARRHVFRKMIQASLIAGFLLALVYVGLTYVSAHYSPVLPDHQPEERLAAVCMHLIGSKGALFSCLAVSLSCLTTAIPISIISADYIHQDLMKKRGSISVAIAISLGLSIAIANLGFMGIAQMLSPILQILCPGLIILSILNILHKLYEMRMRKAPVFVAFVISLIAYIVRV